MRKFRLRQVLRLAVIVLLALNVVPEALAAFPVCKADFASPATMTTVGARAAVRHSHGTAVAHECLATMPDRQSVAHQAQFAPDSAIAVLPSLPHPVAMLAARGPSPRGSPAGSSAYLMQRSSVLLLI